MRSTIFETDTGTTGDGQRDHGLPTPTVTCHSTWSISYSCTIFRDTLTAATWPLLHTLTL